MRRPESECFDQCGEPVREVRQAEDLRQVGGPSSSRFVPCHNGELVGKAGQLRLPHPTVHGRAVDEDHRRPLTDPLIGDRDSAGLDKLHGDKVLTLSLMPETTTAPGIRVRSNPSPATSLVAPVHDSVQRRGLQERLTGRGQISRQVSANASAAELPNHPSG